MFVANVPQDVCESLRKGGLEPKDVETIVLSHLHFDHVGNPSRFPGATFVVGGASRDQLASGFKHDSFQALLLSASFPLERTRFLSLCDFKCSIGPFPRAMDYFGDGSLYLIDAAGHLAGHINVLARTSATGSWIYLAGDSAHDVRILSGEKEVAFTTDPSSGAVTQCAHSDKDQAIEHIGRVRELMKVRGVLVLLAHDWKWFEDNKGGPAFFPGTIPPVSL
jgi:glyoxylase-like metal-dependent hydrolase (beta-lactamase superfamily II)